MKCSPRVDQAHSSFGSGHRVKLSRRAALETKAAAEQTIIANKALDKSVVNNSKYLASIATDHIDKADIGTGLLLALEALPDYRQTDNALVDQVEQEFDVILVHCVLLAYGEALPLRLTSSTVLR